MKKFIVNNRIVIVTALAGGIAGFLYWQYVGCISGSCPITSYWWNSTLYGSLMGGLLGNMFVTEKSKKSYE